jgi:hypothetical protein
MDHTTIAEEFLRPLVSGWLNKIECAARSKARTEWKDAADESAMFYSNSAAAMWNPNYSKRFWKGVKLPKFRITINKAFEMVAIFSPSLIWDVPHRTVDAKRVSNGKTKGENNQKCGNKYLAWAFVEAAHGARRFDTACRRWYDRKEGKRCPTVATKALACKLAKAAWYVMAKGEEYQAGRVFPGLTEPKAEEISGEQASARKGVGPNPED